MRATNTHWKLIAIGILAMMVTIWVGSRMEAKSGQDYDAQSARVSPQVREAAINAFGPIGLTHGQTLRIGLLAGPGAGPHVVQLTLSDCHGNIHAMANLTTGPNECSFFDLNADQLSQVQFDNTGRAEVIATLKGLGGAKPRPILASAQLFDNSTGVAGLAARRDLRRRRQS